MNKIYTGWIYGRNKDWLDLWTKLRLAGFMDKIKTGWIYEQKKRLAGFMNKIKSGWIYGQKIGSLVLWTK